MFDTVDEMIFEEILYSTVTPYEVFTDNIVFNPLKNPDVVKWKNHNCRWQCVAVDGMCA